MNQEEVILEYYQIIKNKISQLEFTSAIRSAEKLLYNFPNNPYGYYFKGLCEFAMDKLEDSVNNYQKAIKLNPSFARAYFNLGVSFFELKCYDHALINFAKAMLIFSKQRDIAGKRRCLEALRIVEGERI